MAEIFLKVNGVSMPCPSSYTWGLQDVSAAKSGRSDDSVMHKNRVAQKRKLALQWNGKDWATTAKILQSRVHPNYISRYDGWKIRNQNVLCW